MNYSNLVFPEVLLTQEYGCLLVTNFPVKSTAVLFPEVIEIGENFFGNSFLNKFLVVRASELLLLFKTVEVPRLESVNWRVDYILSSNSLEVLCCCADALFC